MAVEAVLTAFAARNRLDPPPPKADGSRVLVFDGRYKVSFRDEDLKTVRATARVGVLPNGETERREALERLLSLATARMREHAEILYLAEDERTINLFRRFPSALPPHEFDSLLTGMVNSLAFWRRTLAEGASRAAAPSPFQMMFR